MISIHSFAEVFLIVVSFNYRNWTQKENPVNG